MLALARHSIYLLIQKLRLIKLLKRDSLFLLLLKNLFASTPNLSSAFLMRGALDKTTKHQH